MIKISDIPKELGTREGVRSILDTYRRFPSLYSSWEDLFLHHLGNSDFEWHKGNIRMAAGGYLEAVEWCKDFAKDNDGKVPAWIYEREVFLGYPPVR